MTEIGHHDDVYRSTPLEQKLAWFQNAPGLSAVEPARQFMAGAAALYTDSDSAVRTTIAQSRRRLDGRRGDQRRGHPPARRRLEP